MRIIGIILVVLVALEIWRQGTPATVRLRQTIEFETPGGPVTGSSVVELQQYPAVPYLPGGEFGHHKTEGTFPCALIDGKAVYLRTYPGSLMDESVRQGRVSPPIAPPIKGRMYKVTADLYRRLKQAGATVTVPIADLPDYTMDDIRLTSVDPGPMAGSKGFSDPFWTVEAFAQAHPGVRLTRVIYSVTKDPIGPDGSTC
jgi:hypothetical protein